jgi:hypothetical protein
MRLDALCCIFFVGDFRTGFSCFLLLHNFLMRLPYEISCYYAAVMFPYESSCLLAVTRFPNEFPVFAA